MMGSVPKDYLFLRLFMPLQGRFAQLRGHATALESATVSTQVERFAVGRSNGARLAREASIRQLVLRLGPQAIKAICLAEEKPIHAKAGIFSSHPHPSARPRPATPSSDRPSPPASATFSLMHGTVRVSPPNDGGAGRTSQGMSPHLAVAATFYLEFRVFCEA